MMIYSYETIDTVQAVHASMSAATRTVLFKLTVTVTEK